MKEASEYILGIETSARTFSIALTDGESPAACVSRGAGRNLDSLLIPEIRALLASAGIKKDRLMGIAASTGPGYFTGIRIGLAAAGGMALALKKPAAGIMSLDSLAENSTPAGDSVICAAIDAGREEIYYRLYDYKRKSDAREPLSPPVLSSVGGLASNLREKTVVLCGNESIGKQIKEAAGERVIIMPPEFGCPSAIKTAALGFKKIKAGEAGPDDLRPVYLKKPDAEENFNRRKAEITIRPASREDIPGIVKIERASFSAPWSASMFEAELTKDAGRFFIAGTGGELAGYACGWYAADEFHLANLAVATEFRGRGAGKKLLQKIIDDVKSRGIGYILLEVRHGNTPAMNLYSEFGFKPAARRKKYYGDTKEDAIVMALRMEYR